MTKILAYRFSAFGDVAMTVPVFREFLDQNPNVEVVMVSRSNFAALFEGLPRFTFHGIDLNEYEGFWGMNRLAGELVSKYKPDLVADLHDVIRTKILDKILKFKGYQVLKIDKGKEEKEALTDVWNLDKQQLKKNSERYADVFRGMGFHLGLQHALKPSHTPKQGIGYAPFAQHRGKMMPLEQSFEAVKHIASKETVYLFGGGKSETEVLSHWEKEIPNTINLAGKLSLKQELEQIARLRLMVSMDSANMHLASLVGTRCISVWAQTHPFAGFLGYGQSPEDVVHVKDLTCRPCSVFGDKICYRGDWACLGELSIEPLLEKIFS